MSITVKCHVCGREWRVSDVYAGRAGLCPGCGEEVTVPGRAGGSPSAYDPASLPPVSSVQVVRLAGVDPNRLRDPKATPGARADGAAAARVADLWRALAPSDDVPATHLPAFGVRFLAEDRVIGWASVCWVIGSVRGEFGGVPADYSFNNLDPAAMELFEEMQRIAGA